MRHKLKNHNYLLPVDDVKFPISLDSDIASAEPVVVERFLCRLRIVVISLCYHWGPNQELAWLSKLDIVIVVIHHAENEKTA